MVYFMQRIDGGPIKIGTTINLHGRRRQLQGGFCPPLIVLAVAPGGAAEEAELHERFDHLCDDRAEFFRPDGELLDFIGSLQVNALPIETFRYAPPGTKQVAYFLDPDLVEDVKLMARAGGQTQSEFVSEALLALIAARPDPRPRTRRRRVVPAAATAR